MDQVWCLKDGCSGQLEVGFDNLGDDATCPDCGTVFSVGYEESYDPDSGDEWGWFYLSWT